MKYEIFQYSKKLAKEALEVYKVILWTSCASPAESQMQQILALITSDQTMTFKTCLHCMQCVIALFHTFVLFWKNCQKCHFIFKLLNCLFVFKYCKVAITSPPRLEAHAVFFFKFSVYLLWSFWEKLDIHLINTHYCSRLYDMLIGSYSNWISRCWVTFCTENLLIYIFGFRCFGYKWS